MATNTPNYNLVKPSDSDLPDQSVLNGNMDKIDTAIKANADNIGLLGDNRAMSYTLINFDQPDWKTILANNFDLFPANQPLNIVIMPTSGMWTGTGAREGGYYASFLFHANHGAIVHVKLVNMDWTYREI